MRKLVARLSAAPFIKALDESGQTMAEYGVLLALITLAVVGSMMVLSGSLSAAFSAVAGAFP
jgi:Flp pilus assembly pilin Flp